MYQTVIDSRKASVLPVLFVIILSGCGQVRELTPINFIALDAVPICYNNGCQARTLVTISAKQWLKIKKQFEPPAPTSEGERHQIRQAVALLERISGQQTPTHRDRGKNPWIYQDFPGAMDCVDESLNSTTYLKLFEQQGLLRWHKVLPRVYRAPFLLDLHYSARIKDISSNREFVVDSWFLDNGHLPYIQEVNDWYAKKPFPKTENP